MRIPKSVRVVPCEIADRPSPHRERTTFTTVFWANLDPTRVSVPRTDIKRVNFCQKSMKNETSEVPCCENCVRTLSLIHMSRTLGQMVALSAHTAPRSKVSLNL